MTLARSPALAASICLKRQPLGKRRAHLDRRQDFAGTAAQGPAGRCIIERELGVTRYGAEDIVEFVGSLDGCEVVVANEVKPGVSNR